MASFLVGDVRDDYQVRIGLTCVNGKWHVKYERNDTGGGNITVGVVSFQKNNGLGTLVTEELVDVPMRSNITGVVLTQSLIGSPPFVVNLDPYYLQISRNYSWFAERSTGNVWLFYSNQTADNCCSGQKYGEVQYNSLKFTGPTSIPNRFLTYNDRDQHDTGLSCNTWSRPVNSGIWGPTRWNADTFESYCKYGIWWVNATQNEETLQSNWVSFKLLPYAP